VTIEADSMISLGKYGRFETNSLIGQRYGLQYEITDQLAVMLRPKTIQEIGSSDATNEMIYDDRSVQLLTVADIEALKESGVHALDIIQTLIETHTTYPLKNEYSKQKYKKRKEAKFLKSFTVVEPTLQNVCDYWSRKNAFRNQEIGPDTLSQLMTLANVKPGGRCIVVSSTPGTLLNGILERLGGEGCLITIYDVDIPPAHPTLSHTNVPCEIPVDNALNWLTANEHYSPLPVSTRVSSCYPCSERERRLTDKHAAAFHRLLETRKELFSGDFISLVVASSHDPFTVVEKLSRYLSGSASVVVHSPYIQTLCELFSKMKQYPDWLGLSITDTWLRKYQALPGRTHPSMTMPGSGGFILHAIKLSS